MKRRSILGALACLPAAARATSDESAPPQRPRYKISAAQLHASLSSRFPLSFGVVEVLQLQISAPRLHLLPSRNRLGAGLVAQASGPMLQQAQGGEVDISFGLTYSPSDRTVRAHRPELMDVRLPGLPPEARAPLHAMALAMTRQAVGQIVLHRFTPNDLALADTMGFEVESIEVVEDGLMVLFGEKKQRG